MPAALLLLLALTARPPPPKLAMPEWQRVDVPLELAAFYSESFAKALRSHGLQVVTAQEISTMLGVERQKQLLGCADSTESCMAELGNALGCDLVVKVTVAKLPDGLRANVVVLSAVNGTVKTEVSVASDEKRFFIDLDEAAATLADRLIPKVPMTKGTARKLFWLPAGAGAIGLVLGIVGSVLASTHFTQLSGASEFTLAQAYADSGNLAQNTSRLGFAVFGLGAIAATLMYLLGGPREIVE